ncbi:MAG: hypothetical protein ACKPKO_28325 [Candidatus Fonsibacter sp.]
MYKNRGINTWAVKCDISNNGDIHVEGNGSFTGTLSAVGNITSNTGNITSTIGNISAYWNVKSYNGNITAPWGNISGKHIINFNNNGNWKYIGWNNDYKYINNFQFCNEYQKRLSSV